MLLLWRWRSFLIKFFLIYVSLFYAFSYRQLLLYFLGMKPTYETAQRSNTNAVRSTSLHYTVICLRASSATTWMYARLCLILVVANVSKYCFALFITMTFQNSHLFHAKFVRCLKCDTMYLISLRNIICENGSQMKVAHDCIHWRAAVLAVLKFICSLFKDAFLVTEIT
jgi:hypothetical protein